jgi:hypothetical protein
MTYEVKLKDEDGMLRLKCDIHSWMTAERLIHSGRRC